MIEAVLFDLDGTLLDTAPDLIRAVNRLRVSLGLTEVPVAQVRPFVSKGGKAMIQAAFPDWSEDRCAPLLQPFLDFYRERVVVDTALFSGFEETLQALERQRLPMAIVTNKPAWLTHPVLAETGLAARFRVVISGDSLPERKPHPAPVLEACRLLGVATGRAVMVGDDERDIISARAAGARSIAVRFGYAGADEDPDQWQADAVIDTPGELIQCLAAMNGKVL
jgi:N-acetyl-D-muramate 6-phosphate phosphatase